MEVSDSIPKSRTLPIPIPASPTAPSPSSAQPPYIIINERSRYDGISSVSPDVRYPQFSPESSPSNRRFVEIDHLKAAHSNENESSSIHTSPSLQSLQATQALTVQWRKKIALILVGLPARGKSFIANKLVSFLRWRGIKAQLFNVGKARRSEVSLPQSSSFFDANNKEAQQARDMVALTVLRDMLDWLMSNQGDVAIFDATNTSEVRRQHVLAECGSKCPLLPVIFIESICDDVAVLESNYISKAKNSPDYKHMPLDQALKDLKERVANYEKIYEPITNDKLSYLKMINLNSKMICNQIHGQMAHLIASYLMSIHIRPRPIFLIRTAKCEGEERVPLTHSPHNSENLATYQMPFTISMAANLTPRGLAFAERLKVFMENRLDEYAQEYLQNPSFQSGRGFSGTASHETTSLHPSISMPTLGNSYLKSQIGTPPTDIKDQTLKVPAPTVAPSPPPGPLLSPQAHGREGLPEVQPPSSKFPPLYIYSSTLPRAYQTVRPLLPRSYLYEQTSALNMLDTGVCHGLPMEEIRDKYPAELEKWHQQKYYYRFPGGESQMDKAKSLEPLIMELERHVLPVAIVSHNSTLQVLYGYFLGMTKNVDNYYKLNIPQHYVIELIPHQYGWKEIRHDLRSPAEKAQDTFLRRERGLNAGSSDYNFGPVPVTANDEEGSRLGFSSSQVVSHGVEFYDESEVSSKIQNENATE